MSSLEETAMSRTPMPGGREGKEGEEKGGKERGGEGGERRGRKLLLLWGSSIAMPYPSEDEEG